MASLHQYTQLAYFVAIREMLLSLADESRGIPLVGARPQESTLINDAGTHKGNAPTFTCKDGEACCICFMPF